MRIVEKADEVYCGIETKEIIPTLHLGLHGLDVCPFTKILHSGMCAISGLKLPIFDVHSCILANSYIAAYMHTRILAY